MSFQKLRLDHLLVVQGYAETRSKAQALIMSGCVLVEDAPITKSGQMVAENTAIRLKGKDHPWVSRGGQKLAHAITHFGLQAEGRIAMDVGASTGGFTDVLLHHGAVKIYAVDVGHGQLDWRLRCDARVIVLEKTNARYVSAEQIADPLDIIVCDASFISLKTILPAPLSLAAPQSWLCALIKPQFEAGREHIGKNGVVRDAAIHAMVCDDMAEWMAGQQGWEVAGITQSPITGPKGNVEFLLVARKGF